VAAFAAEVYHPLWKAKWETQWEGAMIELRDKETGRMIGTITEDQLRFLVGELEEESSEDTDYYINKLTLDMLAEHGADQHLLELLRAAMGSREEMEVKYSRV
jgi:processive 1,2-diacylglycerol beta-glucosyltransferase